MKQYTYYNTQTEKFKNFKDFARYTLPLGDYIELERIATDRPVSNPATHKLTSEWVIDLEGKTYTQVWTETALSEYEIAMRDWADSTCQFRIVCPKQLGEQYPSIYVHFQMEDLLIEKHPDNEDLRRIYINTILPHHSDLMESLQDVVDVEPRPEVLNPV